MSKYPKCECRTTRFDYFRKQYKNGTLHLMRQCPQCGKVAQNAMRQDEYDRGWVDGLPLMTDGVIQPTIQSRAEAIEAKLRNHIENRSQHETINFGGHYIEKSSK